MLSAFIEWFAQKVLGHCLFFFWLAATSPPLLFLIWLRHYHEEYTTLVSWLGVPLALAWLLGSWWLAMTTARHMFEEKRLFFTAVKYTLSDLWLKLAFLPFVGHFFTPDEDKTHHDGDDA